MHRFSLGALALVTCASSAYAKEIGTFPSADGAWEVTLATLPADGQDRPLDKWHVTSLEARVAPRGTDAAHAEAAVTLPPFADAAPAPSGAPGAVALDQWLAGVPAPALPGAGSEVPLAPVESETSGLVASRADADDLTPSFDARMPEHGHGMLLKPRLTALAPDLYRIDGVKLHMAGTWEIALTLPAGGEPARFVIPVQL